MGYEKGFYKEVQTSERIFAADVANCLIDATDAAAKVKSQFITTERISTIATKVFIENFYGLFLRTKEYVKKEESEKIAELFNGGGFKLDGGFTKKMATTLLDMFEHYITAIHASPLIKLIEQAVVIRDIR